MKKEKIKTPKLKSEDRIKVINLPELLAVVPLSEPALIRYGNNTEWCVSAPKNRHAKGYLKRGLFIIVMMYNLDNNGSRIGDAYLKFILFRKWNDRVLKKKQTSQWEAYDLFDNIFDFRIVEQMIEEKFGLMTKADDIFQAEKLKHKRNPAVFIHDFKVGQIVKGISDKIVTLNSGQFKQRNKRVWYYGRGSRVINKKIPLQEIIKAEVHVNQIEKALITKVTGSTVHVDIIDINTESKTVNHMHQQNPLRTIVRIGKNDLAFEKIN